MTLGFSYITTDIASVKIVLGGSIGEETIYSEPYCKKKKREKKEWKRIESKKIEKKRKKKNEKEK